MVECVDFSKDFMNYSTIQAAKWLLAINIESRQSTAIKSHRCVIVSEIVHCLFKLTHALDQSYNNIILYSAFN